MASEYVLTWVLSAFSRQSFHVQVFLSLGVTKLFWRPSLDSFWEVRDGVEMRARHGGALLGRPRPLFQNLPGSGHMASGWGILQRRRGG